MDPKLATSEEGGHHEAVHFGHHVWKLVTGTVVGAGNLYDSKGNVNAPRGSQQQFDYFRQRQQQIDISNMRKQAEQQEFDRKLGKNPC